jgi:hypothetical protein
MLPGVAVNHDLLIERAISVVQSGRRRLVAPFRADVIAITANSVLQTPPKERYDIARSREHLAVDFEGRKVLLPAAMAGILETMCAHATFRVAELATGANTEAVLTFARALQSIGFLHVRRA